MALLLQYYRVLAVRRMRIPYIITMVVVAVWGIAQVFTLIFMCLPIEAVWDMTVVQAICIPLGVRDYILPGGNILLSVVIFFLPMPAIKHLNLPSAERLLLVGIFGLGLLYVDMASTPRHERCKIKHHSG